MTRQEIESHLVELIETKLHVERHLIRPSARIIDDLGADSLAVMEIIMAMEDEFGIEIRDAEAEALSTVQDVMRFLDRQLGAAGA